MKPGKIYHFDMSAGKAIDRQVKSDLAQEYMGQIRKLIFQSSYNILELGRLLLIFKEEKLYDQLGHEKFSQFISDPEIGLAPSTAYNAVRLYDVFCRKLEIPVKELSEIPWSKLQMLAPIVDEKEKNEAMAWIDRARVLGAGDFGDEVNEYKKNKGHKDKLPYPKIRRCQDCKLWKVEFQKDTACTCGSGVVILP